jgi:Leucine-rich repeat (LRR) protein
MNFPKAKALILNFSASEYFLPPFMGSMPKLKVLIIVNHSSKRATLKGISVFSSLTRLKVVRLERVIIPPFQEYCKSWQNLEKLSLVLCEGCATLTRLTMGMYLNFRRLLEFTIDHCSNLEELPVSICNMTSLQLLSVTNCHDLRRLSNDIGNLSSLRILRLYACPSLEELPYSICKLRQLLFLDISVCGCLKQLPDQLGELSSLKELDMRECSRVKKLPKSASGLRSLVHVICDEKIGHQWSDIKASTMPDLWVEVAKEHFHLDWLDD